MAICRSQLQANANDGFVPRHRTDSRPWLLSSPGGQLLDKKTTTQTVFTAPVYDHGRSTGRRRELLEQFFWQHNAEEVLQDLSKPRPIEPYSSEYDGQFNILNYKPAMEMIPSDLELHRRYPLYSDAPYSFWQQHSKDASTKPFKRNTAFSKPISEVLDERPDGLV